jgi:hypothetical protein
MVNPNILIKQYSNESLDAAANPLSPQIANVYGNLSGFDFQLTVSASGTLVSPNNILSALQEIEVDDANSQPIYQLDNLDLPNLAYMQSSLGKTFVIPTVSTSSASVDFFLPWTMKVADQPLTLKVTLAGYGALASSGATGGTVSLAVRGAYNQFTGAYPTLRMLKARVPNLAVGDNELQKYLASNVIVSSLSLFDEGSTDANTNYITFRPSGAVDIEKIQPSNIIALENANTVSGHIAGLYPLPEQAYQNNPATYLSVNLINSTTYRIYQLYQT